MWGRAVSACDILVANDGVASRLGVGNVFVFWCVMVGGNCADWEAGSSNFANLSSFFFIDSCNRDIILARVGSVTGITFSCVSETLGVGKMANFSSPAIILANSSIGSP